MLDEPGSAFADLEAMREQLRTLIAGRDMATLSDPPANGAWSIVENLRHLLFAEQAHLGRFATPVPRFSALGLPPPGMMGNKRVGLAGTQPATDAFEVFAAWDACHAELRQSLPFDDHPFQAALEKHLKHLRLHVGIIQRLLRRADKA